MSIASTHRRQLGLEIRALLDEQQLVDRVGRRQLGVDRVEPLLDRFGRALATSLRACSCAALRDSRERPCLRCGPAASAALCSSVIGLFGPRFACHDARSVGTIAIDLSRAHSTGVNSRLMRPGGDEVEVVEVGEVEHLQIDPLRAGSLPRRRSLPAASSAVPADARSPQLVAARVRSPRRAGANSASSAPTAATSAAEKTIDAGSRPIAAHAARTPVALLDEAARSGANGRLNSAAIRGGEARRPRRARRRRR